MNLKEDIKPISYVKANAAEVLKKVSETGNPMVITQNGESKAVLLDVGTYQSMVDALSLLKILSISEKEIEEGHVCPMGEVFDRLRQELR